MNTIDIVKYRGKSSSTFTGRPQGIQARTEIGLDELDQNNAEFEIQIPLETTSFNPSFFLGLFYPSIKRLGIEGFNKKYKLVIPENQDQEIRSVLMDNIEDGKRNALNELNKRTGFRHLLVK